MISSLTSARSLGWNLLLPVFADLPGGGVARRHKWAYYSVAPDAGKELSTWLT